jgi:hypothetical protein
MAADATQVGRARCLPPQFLFTSARGPPAALGAVLPASPIAQPVMACRSHGCAEEYRGCVRSLM